MRNYDADEPNWNSNDRFEMLIKNIRYISNIISYRYIEKVGIKEIESCKGRSIIFPLHLEPELNIDTCGRYWENQRETILKIWRQLGPEDQLFIKEHPVAIGNRSAHWYRFLLDHPNLHLLNHDLSVDEILPKIDYVFTISGTMGLEAALMGLKVFCLAPTSYDRLENVVSPGIVSFLNAYNIDDLYDTLKSEKTLSWTREEFLFHVNQYSFAGDPEGNLIANPDAMCTDNIRKVALAFEFLLCKYSPHTTRQN
jgi:hypothetical protein